MTDAEFLEICRKAAAPDTGGMWTDDKAIAVAAVEADPRGAVKRLYTLYDKASNDLARERERSQRLEDALIQHLQEQLAK